MKNLNKINKNTKIQENFCFVALFLPSFCLVKINCFLFKKCLIEISTNFKLINYLNM